MGLFPGRRRASDPTIYDVLPTQFAQQLMQQVRQALETGKVQVFECEQALEGKLSEWEIRTVRSGDDEALSIIRDITERKRTEKALQESEERYALASLAANDGLWDWDLITNEVHFSTRWKLLLGFRGGGDRQRHRRVVQPHSSLGCGSR